MIPKINASVSHIQRNCSMERINGRLAAKLLQDKSELYKIICEEKNNKEFIEGIREAITSGVTFIKKLQK